MDIKVVPLSIVQLCAVVSTSTPGVSGPIVGRAVTTQTAPPGACSECCETSTCNRQLCQSYDPTCHDAGHIDCAVTGSFVNVCAEKERAKQECRRFCGLCSVVDGGWSHWSAWSSCSPTCGNGTTSRTRTCSDPAPADGGSDCIGATDGFNTCSNSAACPVSGGWSVWSAWGSCSVTCGIGLQRRDRTCSSPYPSYSGDHCFGDSRDDQICSSPACQDGGWTDWGGWAACSKTCETGTRKRSRFCTNPSPSVLGRFCIGDNIQVDTCATKPCHDQAIGFTVNSPADTATPGHITFTQVVTNQGGGYNTATGEFICSVAGMYTFSLTIQKASPEYEAICNVYKNFQYLGVARVYSSNWSGYVSGSVTVYVHLVPGDRVNLHNCSAASTMVTGSRFSTFTGYLVHSD